MDFEITTNAAEARHWFDMLSRDQLPFATSSAINKLAWDIRDAELSSMENYFEIRTSWLTKRGALPVIRSDKRQFPDIHAILGVKDDVAAMSITGGVRKASSGQMAVPFSNAGDGNSSRSILNPGKETLPKSKWPSTIVKAKSKKKRRKSAKPMPFYIKSGTRSFVALRSSSSHGALKFLYEFKDRVNIKKTWPLVHNAEQFISDNYDTYLSKAIDRAVGSMRI